MSKPHYHGRRGGRRKHILNDAPKPHYQTYPGPGGKRLPMQTPMRSNQPPMGQQVTQDPPSSNSEEIQRFLIDSWTRATRDYSENDPHSSVIYYSEAQPNPNLKDFKPVDLEAFFARRRAEKGSGPSS